MDTIKSIQTTLKHYEYDCDCDSKGLNYIVLYYVLYYVHYVSSVITYTYIMYMYKCIRS